jgi:hypothetical protein
VLSHFLSIEKKLTGLRKDWEGHFSSRSVGHCKGVATDQ